MKVDMTASDISLILNLLTESAQDDMLPKPAMLYSAEEIMLLEKLEAALRKTSIVENDILDTGSNGLYH